MFGGAHEETRTPKSNDNGFWDRNVYQFRHVGQVIYDLLFETYDLRPV